VVALVGALPLPHRTVAQGVIWTPEESWVRSREAGIIAEVLVAPGQIVTAGEPLLRVEDPALVAQVAVIRAQLAEVDARYDAAMSSDRVAAATLRAQQSLARERLADAEARVAALIVQSPADGVLLFPQPPADLPGRYVQRGEALAYVASRSRLAARVVVPQEAVDLVRQRTAAVHARLAENLGDTFAATVVREVPAATAALPSGALGLAGGGEIATDPRSARGDTAFQSLFVFDVELDAMPPESPRLGGRVYVRFDHGAAPLASRWYRSLRQLLLERLHV
jgi:putative peptide zinc metalloprotease protein